MNKTLLPLHDIISELDITKAVSTLQPLLAKTDIYFTELMMDSKGFVYQKDDKEVFIHYNKKGKSISQFTYQMDSEELSESDLLEALLLLAIEEELVGDFKARLLEEAAWKEIADAFIELVETKKLSIPSISEDSFEYDVKKVTYVLSDVLSPLVSTEETNVEEKAEEPSEEIVVTVTKTVTSELIANDTQTEDVTIVQESLDLFEQPSLFEEEVVSETKKKAKSRKKAPKKKQERPALTREEAIAKVPRFFDDEWARKKLESFDDFPTRLINYVIKFRQKQRDILTPEQIALIPTNTRYTGWSEPIRHGIGALLGRTNLVIRGESSTGKTTLTKTICALLNYPMTFAGASINTSLDDLIGVNTLEDGNVGVINAPLITAMKEGGVFYLDEGNAAMPNVLIQLHSAIDDERMIYNMLTGEEIHAHENFLFVTCINDDYIGTNEIGEGTIDRVLGIQTKYMSEKQLENYLKQFPGDFTSFQKEVLELGNLTDDEIYLICDIATVIQTATASNGLPEKMGSLRNMNALYKLIPILGAKDVVKMIVCKYPRSERDALAAVISQVESLDMTANDILAM